MARCPYNPLHNSTALITSSGELYAATAMDFSGRDPAIYRSLGGLPLCVLLNTTLNGSMVLYERYLIQLWHYEKELKSLLAIKWLIVVFGKCGIKCGSPKNLISVIIYSPSCHSKTAWISFCNTNKDIRQNGSLHHCSLLLHQKKM